MKESTYYFYTYSSTFFKTAFYFLRVDNFHTTSTF